MNRNNFLPHLALALVLILVAAFAGQLRKWQKHWCSSVRDMIPASKSHAGFDDDENTREDGERFNHPEILVKFHAGTSEDTIRKITSRFHDRVEDEIESVSGLTAIDDQDNDDPDALVAEYSALPEVDYAEPNYEITLEHAGGGFKHSHPDDPRFSDQWALDNQGQREGKEGADISAMRAWATTKGSDDIVVAVLDTGVDYTHQDLVGNIWTRPASIDRYEDSSLGVVDDVHGFNAIDIDSDPMDKNGHGTHCAGIIGAEGGNGFGVTGVNWRIRIMPLKFMSAGGFGTTKDAIECINYAIDRKHAGVNIRVINASWGSTQKSRALEEIIREAYKNGILFVAASGNSGTNTDKTPHYPASFNVGNIISVAALNRNDELASFSNYGAKSVHVAAPGVEILSTWLANEFEEHSGTSMATPVVAGVAALVLSKDPKLTVDELRELLLQSVDRLPNLKGKTATEGRINAARAVGAL
jgi:subtilisin family serine protease